MTVQPAIDQSHSRNWKGLKATGIIQLVLGILTIILGIVGMVIGTYLHEVGTPIWNGLSVSPYMQSKLSTHTSQWHSGKTQIHASV